MSWGWTLAGTLFEAGLGIFLFMLAAFAGGGLASGSPLSKRQMAVLNLSLYLLPGFCGCSACVVIVLQGCGAGATSYAWYAMPLAATALYLAYLRLVVRRNWGKGSGGGSVADQERIVD